MIKGLIAYFRENKKRMVLSVIGVAIGVFSLTLMLGISGAMERRVEKSLGKMGALLLVVIPGEVKNLGGRTLQLSFYPTLTVKDAEAIQQKCPDVKAVTPYKEVSPNVHYGGKFISAKVIGVWPTFTEVTGFKTSCGRFLTWSDERDMAQVAVIGPKVAKELFGNGCPVGKTVYLFNAPYKVVGVMEKRGTDLSGEDLDSRIYVPLSSAMKRLSNVTYLDGILVIPQGKESLKPAIEEIESLLLKRHGKKDFTVSRYEDVANTQKQAMEIFSKLSLTVTAVAFGVGALGILAVMTLSVYERLVEIGVKRAFGARKRDIFLQFLVESALLSLAGGTAGAFVSLGIVAGISTVAGWGTYVPVKGAVLALILTLIIGIVAGIYPALRAVSFEPREILKEI
ncbi:ABC transporter permease [Thermovibrio ammonificans]|uniref:ABC3 transporter permease protein domain-containing protein n=1 Tax=Thermovibrio ammonificans (strain DSM 15698 / JCM 12110 / HB-1) TaxID=648996 RepID=E8T1V3_THEA1|nr:ABC transporter permease [Thermovibrio ammonificans]ADU96848.1 protein of unknown function DUF214 [Thermovibrio ammonificans HB-1]